MTVSFSNVDTAGTTLINLTSGPAGPLPSNFSTSAQCLSTSFPLPSYYADITTTAGWMGDVEICFPYIYPPTCGVRVVLALCRGFATMPRQNGHGGAQGRNVR